MIWKIFPEVEAINNFNNNTLVSHLGIEITEFGPDYVKARMPVDHRTRQPMGLLHGGASVVLSESVGSMASWLTLGEQNVKVVGIEVNANHLKSVSKGFVTSVTKPVKLGKSLHVWSTEIFDENGELLCISRLTVMIIK
ncbi:MAG: hotdog fold thioesterase [Saprospiraceae bacterium]|jgi:1,4-dihydroxy-2-naphthoyl-CoA hydrolase|nr:hotdog fold thioesterase [Saprospiraceae bacterium]MBK9564576.1 hotdog fold thioesterase [Saprospiraceae bacterium]MBP6446944.1 hotdog fold thioesterase [Saprospiraceae bacterium]